MHRERPFFKDLVRYMTSGPVMVQVLEGENAIARNREIMGATDPKKAAPGTIRADHALEHRAERGARLGRAGDGGRRDRLLLPHDGAASARLRPCAFDEIRHAMNSLRSSRTNLLGPDPPGAGGVRRGAGQQAVPRAPAHALAVQARRGLVRAA